MALPSPFFLMAALVVLVCLMLFAKYIPIRTGVVYVFVGLGFVAVLWAIPQLLDMTKFYDYFINTLIVTVGTVVVSISIGALAGYGLARYAGMAGVVILIAALGFRALPRLAFILPYYQIGAITNTLDTLLSAHHHIGGSQPTVHDLDVAQLLYGNPEGIGGGGDGRWMQSPHGFHQGDCTHHVAGHHLDRSFFPFACLQRVPACAHPGSDNWTLPVAISRFTGGEDPRHLTLAAASAVSATIPIVIVILFFQKNLVKGLAAGAVKG